MGRNNPIKTERTQIHFLSDVFVAVALLDVKVLNVTDDGICKICITFKKLLVIKDISL